MTQITDTANIALLAGEAETEHLHTSPCHLLTACHCIQPIRLNSTLARLREIKKCIMSSHCILQLGISQTYIDTLLF